MDLLKHLIVPCSDNSLDNSLATQHNERKYFQTSLAQLINGNLAVDDLQQSTAGTPNQGLYDPETSVQTAYHEGRQSQQMSSCTLASSSQALSTDTASLRHSDLLPDFLPDFLPDPAVALTAHPRKKIVCHYWYHRGMCEHDPESPNYIRSGKICKYLHRVNANMGDFAVSKVPGYLHKQPCGLPKCSQNGRTPRMKPPLEAPDFLARSDQETTPNEASNPNKGRPGEHKMTKGKLSFQRSRKSHERGITNKSSFPKSVAKPIQKSSKKRKRGSSNDGTTATKPLVRKAAMGEICFFWYHCMCQRGPACNMLHALTEPPTAVRPPPRFVHFDGPCKLRLCPGDYKRVDDEAYAKANTKDPKQTKQRFDDGHKSRIAKLAMVHDGTKEEAAVADSIKDDQSKQDWFLDGFPDAL